MPVDTDKLIAWFQDCGRCDVARVGGKNASLGEMIRSLGGEGISVPDGFATTAQMYWQFIDANGLRSVISETLAEREAGSKSLAEAGNLIREAITEAW